jgi:hypothetical protein
VIALFLAVITLSNADPDAVKPAPVVLTKTADATRLLGLSEPLAGLQGADDASISVCTFGAPPLGPQLWNDATGLSRTFTLPQCAGDPAGFDSTFGMQNFGGQFGPFTTALPLATLRSQAPVTFLESPVTLRESPVRTSVPSFPAVHLLGITEASGGFSFHEPAEYAGIHAVHGELHEPTASRPISPTHR